MENVVDETVDTELELLVVERMKHSASQIISTEELMENYGITEEELDHMPDVEFE